MEDLQSPAVETEPYRALVHCVQSRHDSNGNAYWFAIFTNPLTQRSVSAQVDGEGNARSLANGAIFGWEDTKYGKRPKGYAPIYSTVATEFPIRLHDRRRNGYIKEGMYEGSPALTEALHKLFSA